MPRHTPLPCPPATPARIAPLASTACRPIRPRYYHTIARKSHIQTKNMRVGGGSGGNSGRQQSSGGNLLKEDGGGGWRRGRGYDEGAERLREMSHRGGGAGGIAALLQSIRLFCTTVRHPMWVRPIMINSVRKNPEQQRSGLWSTQGNEQVLGPKRKYLIDMFLF